MAAADESEKKSTIREYYEALLIAIVFVNFARIFAFQAFKIPSGSMEDNLKIGDQIAGTKFKITGFEKKTSEDASTGFVRDVSARKVTEDALAESERRFTACCGISMNCGKRLWPRPGWSRSTLWTDSRAGARGTIVLGAFQRHGPSAAGPDRWAVRSAL